MIQYSILTGFFSKLCVFLNFIFINKYKIISTTGMYIIKALIKR